VVAGKGIKEHGNGAIMGDVTEVDLYIHEINGTAAKRTWAGSVICNRWGCIEE
jgi:hypothetical protein